MLEGGATLPRSADRVPRRVLFFRADELATGNQKVQIEPLERAALRRLREAARGARRDPGLPLRADFHRDPTEMACARNLKPAAAGADNAWKSGSAADLFPERVVPEMTARVLVVDDSAGSVALLEAYLKFEYLEVVSASNGPQALARIAEREPDLVVLDLLMEGMDGFEVC